MFYVHTVTKASSVQFFAISQQDVPFCYTGETIKWSTDQMKIKAYLRRKKTPGTKEETLVNNSVLGDGITCIYKGPRS